MSSVSRNTDPSGSRGVGDSTAPTDPSPYAADFRPTAALEILQRRADLLRQLRDFFQQQCFWEVETPLLSADTVVDRYLEPIAVTALTAGAGRHTEFWLQTSPEFGMKRLLAAGARHIYQVARAFRRDEAGPLHNLEFTLVEWYAVGDDLWQGMRRLTELCAALLHSTPTQITYRDAFLSILQVDPHRATVAELAQTAATHRVSIPASYAAADRDEWLNLLLAERIQPRLGFDRPVILYDYPASQSALARLRQDDQGQTVAARFELYAQGIELANGYHELLDAEELAERQRTANVQRRADGRRELPEHSRLLSAMRHGLPECTGVALGFDRLAMLALQQSQISEVIAFPFDRA